MRNLNATETQFVAGGSVEEPWLDIQHDPTGGVAENGWFGFNTDQRNDTQKAQDERAKAAQSACSFLTPACSTAVKVENFQIQSREFAACIAEGGKPGPSDCGALPKPPFGK